SKLIAKVKSANIKTLNKISALIQRKIMSTPFLPEFEAEISSAYKKLRQPAVAVRSSATTEDLASASFAGAQKTFLNVRGLKKLLRAVKLVYASLYTARAIAY